MTISPPHTWRLLSTLRKLFTLLYSSLLGNISIKYLLRSCNGWSSLSSMIQNKRLRCTFAFKECRLFGSPIVSFQFPLCFEKKPWGSSVAVYKMDAVLYPNNYLSSKFKMKVQGMMDQLHVLNKKRKALYTIWRNCNYFKI